MQYFAIRNWGECYGGKDISALESLVKSGVGVSSNCANGHFTDCLDNQSNVECTGKNFAEYMYKIDTNMESTQYVYFFIVSKNVNRSKRGIQKIRLLKFADF